MSRNSPVTPVTPSRVIMTWNIRWKGGERKLGGWDWDDRLPVIDSVIQRENPDILLLQEDTEDMTADLLFTGFIDQYHLSPTHIPVFLGDKRSTRDRCNHELCGIFWKKGLYECVASGCYEWSSPKTDWVNVFTWVLLNGAHPLLVCNTHLECGLGQLHKQDNSKMVRHIIGLLQQQFEGIPFLLGGDFNTDKSGFDYKLLTGGDLHTFKLGGDPRHDLVDVFKVLRGNAQGARALCHNGTTHNQWKSAEHAVAVSNRKHSRARGHGRHIDHVYIGSVCRDAIHVTDARVVTDCVEHGVFASDHFPIVVNLNIF